MRIKHCFKTLADDQRKALIPYMTAGDPEPKMTVQIMHQLVASGSDIIELGFPFSDPMADGKVIAHAHERALQRGVTLNSVLSMVAEFREKDDVTPVVLMGYLNPVEMMGYKQFAQRASEAGVDGVLIVDLPPEAAAGLVAMLRGYGLDMISLIAPTTADERIEKICHVASGYLYYVSLKGVTGSAALNVAEVESRVGHIKSFTELPVAVGFGISDSESAAAISKVSDGAIVGSVLVSALAKYAELGDGALQAATAILAGMRAAMDAQSASLSNRSR